MKTPYLIQRMKRKKNSPKYSSVDDLYSMDYMGSSEFEWGALPKSLKEFTKNFDNLVIEKTDILNFKEEPLCLLGLPEVVKEYQKLYINDLVAGKIMLKERLCFEEAFSGKQKSYNGEVIDFDPTRHTAAWWDIRNHVIFTFKKLHANKLRNAIRVVLEKKKDANETSWF